MQVNLSFSPKPNVGQVRRSFYLKGFESRVKFGWQVRVEGMGGQLQGRKRVSLESSGD